MFRVKFTRPDGVWWTAPLDWVDANRFIRALGLQGFGADAFPNTLPLEREVRRYAAGVPAQQAATGQRHVGQINITCECGHCPPLSVGTIRVPDRQPADETPRELSGPTADEVAEHTPAPRSPAREGKDGPACGD